MRDNEKRSRNERHSPRLSIVVPCFNEEAVIEQTHAELYSVADSLDTAGLEVIYVDDGSSDATLRRLQALATANEQVRIVALSRNFGHQIAVTAGLEHASGDAVVIIDADLQDPPAVIGEMLALWREGVDVAYGVRVTRASETWFKRWSAKAFYRLINRLSKIEIALDSGDFRLLDRRVVDALARMPERDRFVRGMVAWTGFRQQPVHYERMPRRAGHSKYPLRKMLHFAADGLFSFSNVPLRIAAYLGLAAAGLALLGILYAVFLRLFTDVWVTGWTLLFVAILFLGGVQLLFLGVIGEYLGRIYGEVKHRPLYVIRDRIGFPAASPPANRGHAR